VGRPRLLVEQTALAPGAAPAAMKRAILTAITLLLLGLGPAADARAGASWRILLVGGPEDNWIRVDLAPDGRSYQIDSRAPLEIAEGVCVHPPGEPNRLLCATRRVSGFEVNAGGGDDAVVFSPAVRVPVTVRGGPGNDRLFGGSAADKLIGGAGDDLLVGRAGGDVLHGGPGADKLIGGPGDDVLNGGPGVDALFGGPGRNTLVDRG